MSLQVQIADLLCTNPEPKSKVGALGGTEMAEEALSPLCETSSSLPSTPTGHKDRIAHTVVTTEADTPTRSGHKKIFLNVGGMTCAACSGTIERGLSSIDGVISAKISLITESAEVLFDPSVLSAEQIVEEVEDLGFTASLKAISSKGFLVLICETQVVDPTTLETFLEAQPGVLDARVDRLEVDDSVQQLIHVEVDLNRSGARTLIRLLQQARGITARLQDDANTILRQRQESKAKTDGDQRALRSAFLRSLRWTLPVVFITMLCPMLPFLARLDQAFMFHLHRGFTLRHFLVWVLVTPVQFGVGRRFYTAAYKSLKHGAASMDVLVMLGSSAAYLYSVVSSLICFFTESYHGPVFFETSCMLISIVLLGRYVESIAKGRTGEALSALMSLQPSSATLVSLDEATGNIKGREEIGISLVEVGDVLEVAKGNKAPVDGVVLRGSSHFDEALLTGEALPVQKNEGDHVIGATVNLEGPILMRATGVGSDTTLSKIVAMVNEAQSGKAPIQAFADSVAQYFVPMVVLIALVTFVTWWILLRLGVAPETYHTHNVSDFLFAFMFGVSVLVISCPCSLGLATPTAVMVGTGVGAQLGILFKGGEPLEHCGQANKILFDKTGTLTRGHPTVSALESFLYTKETGSTVMELWCLLGSAELQSEHLLGKAIVDFVKTQPEMHLTEPDFFEAKTGNGVSAVIKGRRVLVGSERYLRSHEIQVWPHAQERLKAIQDIGHIAVCAAVDGAFAAVVAITDALKPEAATVVQHLRRQGIEVYMVTGDSATTATAVGHQLSIPAHCIFSEVTPNGKAEVVKTLQQGGRWTPGQAVSATRSEGGKNSCLVMFVGDGVNDSPALAQSDIGVALGAGTDIAVETAKVVLMREDLTDVLTAMDLSRVVLRRIRINFVWAFIYNVLAIPIAAGIFFPWTHTVLSPALAAASMGCSSVSVVLSSLLLKWYARPNYIYASSSSAAFHLPTLSTALPSSSSFSSHAPVVGSLLHSLNFSARSSGFRPVGQTSGSGTPEKMTQAPQQAHRSSAIVNLSRMAWKRKDNSKQEEKIDLLVDHVESDLTPQAMSEIYSIEGESDLDEDELEHNIALTDL
eukprot:g7840.t1